MTQVNHHIQRLVEQSFGGTKLKIGAIVKHPKHGTVKITDGQYWGTYGISNHWTWREYNTDGKLGKEHSGYGWM